MGWLERFGEGWVEAREAIDKLPPSPARRRRTDRDADRAAAGPPDVASEASASLLDELDEARRVIADLTDAVERQKARADAYAVVLLLPGVKLWLINRFHPDKHPNANEAERAALNETLQTINAAYDALENAR
jgi:hypothetical protein